MLYISENEGNRHPRILPVGAWISSIILENSLEFSTETEPIYPLWVSKTLQDIQNMCILHL